MSAQMEKVREALRITPLLESAYNDALAEVEEWEAKVEDLTASLAAEQIRRQTVYERAEAAEAAIEEALLLLGGIDHDEGSRIGRAIEALEKTCR